MALEAIYGDDLVELENKGGLRYFQVINYLLMLLFHLFLDGGNCRRVLGKPHTYNDVGFRCLYNRPEA
jgi:hypothetical protein